MKRKFAASFLAICALAPLLAACGAPAEPAIPKSVSELELPTQLYQEGEPMQTPWKTGDQYPVVTITFEDGGVVEAELYPDKAPNTVHNFIALAKAGYFTGRVFHRAVANFMIQGGSPNGTSSSEGFPYSIFGEFANNGFTQNTLKHTPGVLSMARVGGMNNSGSCQFFIMHGAADFLDGDYAAFGMVKKGMDVVDRIAVSAVTGMNGDELVTKPVIRSVEVETFGVEYPAPQVIPAG